MTLISVAHGINHAQSALKPLVYPLVLRDLGFGYAELGIMLGVASAVGGSLQFVAGALGTSSAICSWDSATHRSAFVFFSSLLPRASRNSSSGQ